MKVWTRRQILKSSFVATASLGLATFGFERFFKRRSLKEIPVRILGPSSLAGHKMRDGFHFPEPKEFKKAKVLIVGGGIAGLSAGWRLQKKGISDFQILELDTEVGGNSRSGQNAVSKFPWGAHYVTLLNEDAQYAKEMYQDFQIITGERNKKSIYNEYYLCQAPHERLFISQKWQDGLLPKIGISLEEDAQAKAFFATVEKFRVAKGHDGLHAFTIPLELSSRDPQFLRLDQITMSEYLRQNGWDSKPLHWYINYCCRDDYGTPVSQTSAWAGLHYFCSRRGQADGIESSAVLTWPEGNGWIVGKLRERLEKSILKNAMAFRVQENAKEVIVDVWNEAEQFVTRWTAKSLILAVPRFISSHIVQNLPEEQKAITQEISYSPWMVANISLRQAPRAEPGAPLSWDNVFYHGDSLGYVVATHQRTSIHSEETVWTYYKPLDAVEPREARQQALATTADEWRAMILADLSIAHPDISDLIDSIDVWIWGHAMVRPTPGFIWGEERAKMQKNIGRIHFAHSDMSGISIFEEANYHGVKAADEVMKNDLA